MFWRGKKACWPHKGCGRRCFLGIVSLLFFVSFPLWALEFKTNSSCSQVLKKSKEGLRLIDTHVGQKVDSVLGQMMEELPEEAIYLSERFPHKSVFEIAEYIVQTMEKFRRTLLVLSQKVPPTEKALKEALEKAAYRVKPVHSTRRLLKEFRVTLKGSRFPLSFEQKLPKPQYKALVVLTSWIGRVHGALAELRVALSVPDLHRTNQRLREMLTDEEKEAIEEWVNRQEGSLLDMEIDVIYKGGRFLGEVKNYKRTMNESQLQPLLKKVQLLVDFAAFLKRLTGKKVEIVYFFLRGGITVKGRQLLENMGVHVVEVAEESL
ncbi:MAG: hypothetical protein D6797_04960 [Bdellovibrio sp.]|nr:MAG: hypothetical protein D6797_04960 [Bdellovibrio sp.]